MPPRPRMTPLAALNLSLLVLFPLSWAAPLLRAGLLPFFELPAVSVLTGLWAIWEKDPALALLVAFFALLAPYAKTVGLALLHFGRLPPRLLPVMQLLGKLAMADVFLVALYIVLAKGVGMGRVETAWGLWVFTGCILASLAVSLLSKRG